MSLINPVRGPTSSTVSRTNSLRETNRPLVKEEPPDSDIGSLIMNKRSLSNDKMSSDTMVPVFIYQRGSSLRHFGKTTATSSALNSNNHHPFQIIKPIETSPRTSEMCIDTDSNPNMKVSSQRLKFKHRSQLPSQGGPLIPDHNLMKETPRESVTFTPRPPLVKRFSSDLEDTTSDIDSSQCNKTLRAYHIHSSTTTAPKPPISPTRGGMQGTRTSNIGNQPDRADKSTSQVDDDTSELEDAPNSDCETPPPSQYQSETTNGDPRQRSSLRKGCDSPNQSDVPGGTGSPSTTKTVKWNLNTEVKKIPRSRSLNGKFKSPRSRSSKSRGDRNVKISINDLRVVESHDNFVRHCATLMRQQGSLVDNLRHNRISVYDYKKDLTESLECQMKLLTHLQGIIDNMVIVNDEEPISQL